MEATELIKRVRKIEIKTKGLSQHIFAGEYHSAFKGKGIAFSEVREYQYGDDIRNVDWNVTARFNHPYIKVFEEERELTVVLLVDVSGSRFFGTRSQLKMNVITEISAVLSFSAIQNNDKVGVILFSDKIEKFIPPKKGKQHILRIIRELLDFKPENRMTSVTEALRFLSNAIKKRSIVFLISDFMDHHFEDALRIAAKRHDLVGLRIYDIRETELPDIGLINVVDAETGSEMLVDSSSDYIRSSYRNSWEKRTEDLNEIFLKLGVDAVSISTEEDYVRPLINLFKKRASFA
ncbi:MAG TPA: DUF58 domain-containing protein [Bacteroidales bacterium]|nr:DUF58 domain-containing protein [Bacteroidales bacterium]